MTLVFLLLLLLPLSHRSNAMTGCHSDRDKDHRPRVNCTATDLSDVPASIDTMTKVLIFPQNQFSSLTWSSYSHFPELYEIDLSHNTVPEVPLSPSPVLPTLGVLRLVGNRIRTLPPHSFRATPGLLELYLDQNLLETLDDLSFSGLRLLQILELSQNRISVLPPLMFRSLPAIETLVLEQNRIRTMPDQWFSAKPDIPYTYLSQNPWACFCEVGYLKEHLDDQGFNVYTRVGIIITPDEESVTCATPPSLAGRPIVGLEDEEYCPPGAPPDGSPGDSEPQPNHTLLPSTTTTRTTTTMPPTTASTTTVPTTFPTTATTTLVPTTPTTTTATLKPITPPLPLTDTPLPYVVVTWPSPLQVVTWSWQEIVTILVEWVESRERTEGGRVRGGNSWEHRDLYRSQATTLLPHPTMTTTTTIKPGTLSQPPGTLSQPPGTLSQPPRTPTQPPGTLSQPPRTPIQPPTTPTQPPSPRTQTLTTPETTVRQVGGSDPWGDRLGRVGGSAVGGRAVFCWWLFAGCVLLCVLSGGWVCVSGLWLWRVYRTVYRPLLYRGRGGGGGGVKAISLPLGGGGGGVQAIYRSVLFISREEGERDREREKEKEESEGGIEGRVEGGVETKSMYRKSLYRVYSREEKIEGLRDEEESWQTEEGGRKGGGERGGGGREAKKRYSLVLREERVEGTRGREREGERGREREVEEKEWVVGGWEMSGEERGEERGEGGDDWWSLLPSMHWCNPPPDPQPNPLPKRHT